MNSELRKKIKNEVKQIVNDIQYEEFKFNKIFHSNVEFKKSYYKFNKIYEKYGKEAYVKYVPYKYKKQELTNLIQQDNFLEIYEHYGSKTLDKLQHNAILTNSQLNTTNTFKILYLKIRKLLLGNFISLPQQTILALPAKITDFNKNNNVD